MSTETNGSILNVLTFPVAPAALEVRETSALPKTGAPPSGARYRRIVTPVLCSLGIHAVGALVFLGVVNERPVQVTTQPIEVSIVSPPPQPVEVPAPPPLPLRQAAPARQAPVPSPVPAPVAARHPDPAPERPAVLQEMRTSPEPVATALPALAPVSRERSATAVAPLGNPVAQHIQVPTGASKAAAFSASEEPGTGPSFDAAYLNNPKPLYPPAARRLRLQGTATVRVLVSQEGRPKSVRLVNSSGARVLDEAALEAVRNWSFVPARRGARAVAAEVDVPVRFHLN